MSIRTMSGQVYALKHVQMESDSVAGKFYEVTKWDNGRWTCECPAFIRGRHQHGRDIWSRIYCKHIDRAIMADEELPGRRSEEVRPRPMPVEEDRERDGLNLSPELRALMESMG